MLLLLLASFLILFAILFTYRKFKYLSFELSRLPKRTEKTITKFNTNKSLADIEAISKIQKNEVTIVMFASPTCAPCYTEFIDLLELSRELNTPFICLAETSDQDAYQNFISKFGEEAEIYPTSEELLEKLGVDGLPTFFLVDSKGNVLIETVLLTVIRDQLIRKGCSKS
ncbi:TlpA family protein disulfide reductase [Brevibacillus agri]|uniref:TlpA family protein disulfide reductase n=1 Tax=Brevibacillus agri TaxID=51101 RepID=UPI00046E7107|nr:thioredoxin-like domain-containing protein [Brevibacillus agri]MED4572681.1 thioredoxin-like domain-containing protein [Brevibacillus agri]